MRIELEGHSDDIVSVATFGGVKVEHDEIPAWSSADPAVTTLRITTIGGSRAILVRAVYSGTWSFAIDKTDEDAPVPPWSFGVSDGHAYSMRLIVDTGDDLVTIAKDTP